MSTGIEWTDETWNPVTGCTKVSQGCKNCYAERLAPRVFAGQSVQIDTTPPKHPEMKSVGFRPRHFTDVRTHHDHLDAPLRWRNPRKVFVNSMSDLFHEDVPDVFIDQVFRTMIPAKKHTFQILTKRPKRMRAYMAAFKPDGDGWYTRDGRPAMGEIQSSPLIADNNWPPKNIWLGVSVEDQATADERIPLLLQTPAAVLFVSYEPALGHVEFDPAWFEDDYTGDLINGPCKTHPGIKWIIAGGESGPNARPSHPDWFRSVRDQCAAAGGAFFFKQWGEWAPDCLCHRKDACHSVPRPDSGKMGDMFRCGKKAAGRLLDGREHSEYPT